MNEFAEKHILVVEDDAEISRLLRVFLTTEGFNVQVCQRGDQAPLAIRQASPDLVVLDILLPGQDGLSVCQQVRSFYPGPSLMLTAFEGAVYELTPFRSDAHD